MYMNVYDLDLSRTCTLFMYFTIIHATLLKQTPPTHAAVPPSLLGLQSCLLIQPHEVHQGRVYNRVNRVSRLLMVEGKIGRANDTQVKIGYTKARQ